MAGLHALVRRASSDCNPGYFLCEDQEWCCPLNYYCTGTDVCSTLRNPLYTPLPNPITQESFTTLVIIAVACSVLGAMMLVALGYLVHKYWTVHRRKNVVVEPMFIKVPLPPSVSP